jgi:hypothetical protein
MGVFIHYMYTLKASFGKSVINGLNRGKKALAAVVLHIVCFNCIIITSHEKNVLAWHVLRHSLRSCKMELLSYGVSYHVMRVCAHV